MKRASVERLESLESWGWVRAHAGTIGRESVDVFVQVEATVSTAERRDELLAAIGRAFNALPELREQARKAVADASP